MLVEINLLPQKERKKFGFRIAFTCLALLILGIAGYYYWQFHSTNENLANVNKEITVINNRTATQEKNQKIIESTNSATQLKGGLKWVEDARLQTVPMMKLLTSLLPERGFIMSFQYKESGLIIVKVQFDTDNDAAYYLSRLNAMKWIEEASMDSLNIPSQNSTNSQTGGQTGSQQLTNQPASQSNTSNSNLIKPFNQNSTDSSTPSMDIIPRYIAQFEIKFHNQTVKKILATDQNGEGVTGP